MHGLFYTGNEISIFESTWDLEKYKRSALIFEYISPFVSVSYSFYDSRLLRIITTYFSKHLKTETFCTHKSPSVKKRKCLSVSETTTHLFHESYYDLIEIMSFNILSNWSISHLNISLVQSIFYAMRIPSTFRKRRSFLGRAFSDSENLLAVVRTLLFLISSVKKIQSAIIN